MSLEMEPVPQTRNRTSVDVRGERVSVGDRIRGAFVGNEQRVFSGTVRGIIAWAHCTEVYFQGGGSVSIPHPEREVCPPVSMRVIGKSR